MDAGADFDSLSTPLLWTGPGGLIERSNSAFARWLGISPRRLQGLPVAALEFEGDALRQSTRETAPDSTRLHRAALAFPGGEVRFADLWLSRRDSGGWLLEVHPVAEFPGEDPLEALPSALSAALRGLAHELRNPLAGLKGAAQLLARRFDGGHDPGGDSLELTGLIESEVERLIQLLDRLLSPAPPQAHVAVNIHAVLERVLRLAEAEAGWAVKLARDYDPSLPELQGDADRLVQALWNLVRNAIEAGAVNVSLRTRVEHGARIADAAHALSLRLEIIDDGRGVPEELAEQVFLPLVSGRAEGSGLGLALAQQVVREHRGSLAYRSRPGHTVFTLLLPIVLEAGDVPDEAGAARAAGDGVHVPRGTRA